jgi:hypothetical protein
MPTLTERLLVWAAISTLVAMIAGMSIAWGKTRADVTDNTTEINRLRSSIYAISTQVSDIRGDVEYIRGRLDLVYPPSAVQP